MNYEDETSDKLAEGKKECISRLQHFSGVLRNSLEDNEAECGKLFLSFFSVPGKRTSCGSCEKFLARVKGILRPPAGQGYSCSESFFFPRQRCFMVLETINLGVRKLYRDVYCCSFFYYVLDLPICCLLFTLLFSVVLLSVLGWRTLLLSCKVHHNCYPRNTSSGFCLLLLRSVIALRLWRPIASRLTL